MKGMETPKGGENKQKEKIGRIREIIGDAPDVIVVVSGASKYNEQKGRYDNGSFGDVDDSGLITGGKDRVIAGAEVHAAYPDSMLVTTSRTSDPNRPTLAAVLTAQLVRMGVPQEQIIEKDESYRTVDGVKDVMLLVQEKGWKRVVYITSGYHVPRIQEFLKHITEFSSDESEKARLSEIVDALEKGDLHIQVIGSDEILPLRSGHYEEYMKTVKELPGYKERVKSEEQGVQDIREGKYIFRGKNENV